MVKMYSHWERATKLLRFSDIWTLPWLQLLSHTSLDIWSIEINAADKITNDSPPLVVHLLGHLQIVKAAKFKCLSAKLYLKNKITATKMPSCKGSMVIPTSASQLSEKMSQSGTPQRGLFSVCTHTQHQFLVRGCLQRVKGRSGNIWVKYLQIGPGRMPEYFTCASREQIQKKWI